MDTKTNKWKVVGISLSLVIISVASLSLVSGASSAKSVKQANLELIHEELVEVETLLGQGKAEEVRLYHEYQVTVDANNVLREKRENLLLQTTNTINEGLDNLK